MLSKKVFDPKRSPYKQLLEHDGPAIIYVEGNYRGYDRVRVTFPAGNKVPLKDFKAYSQWRSTQSIDDEISKKSCFNHRNGYAATIKAMKAYDKKHSLRVRHIEFY